MPSGGLRELHVRNLAVLAEASVELGGGLNVLTGETGAGKSIVVDSLALLAGARADQELHPIDDDETETVEYADADNDDQTDDPEAGTAEDTAARKESSEEKN